MTHDYTVIYQPIEDGRIMASVPELPGAIAQAPTMEEARGLIQEAVELVREAYRDHAGREAPSGSFTDYTDARRPNRRAVPGVRRRRRLHSHGPANRS